MHLIRLNQSNLVYSHLYHITSYIRADQSILLYQNTSINSVHTPYYISDQVSSLTVHIKPDQIRAAFLKSIVS